MKSFEHDIILFSGFLEDSTNMQEIKSGHSPFSSDLHTEPENRYIVLGCIFMTIQLELPV